MMCITKHNQPILRLCKYMHSHGDVVRGSIEDEHGVSNPMTLINGHWRLELTR